MDSGFDSSSPNSGAFRSQSQSCFFWTIKFVLWFYSSETDSIRSLFSKFRVFLEVNLRVFFVWTNKFVWSRVHWFALQKPSQTRDWVFDVAKLSLLPDSVEKSTQYFTRIEFHTSWLWCIVWLSSRRWCRNYWITWNILTTGGFLRLW